MYRSILLFSIFILGHSLFAQEIIVADDFNVQITIRQHIPYCGGAAPTDEMLNRSILVSSNFVMVNLTTGDKSIISTSTTGMVQLNLPLGKYIIKETFKDVPFEDFFQKNMITGKGNTLPGSEECYRKWWERNLLEFEITPNTEKHLLIASLYTRCFTGNNPCEIYTGPYPP